MPSYLSIVLAIGLMALSGAPDVSGQDAAAHRTRGFELAYNLDYEPALEEFRKAIAAAPDDPASYRAIAAVTWLHIVTMQRGALTVEDFLGRMTKPSVTVEAAPAADAQQFTRHASRALTLAEARVQAQPRDPDSHYQLGATVAVMTSYQAIVEGKALGAFRTAKRAYQSHEEVLRLDPARKDAGLVAGSYRYVVANLSMPMRMLAYVAGFGGGKERGLRLIEEAANYPSDAQPEAQFLLILLYNRELQYDKALQLIGRLQKTYPRNRFLWLNATGTALRAGRTADAERAVEDGLARLTADRRPRAVGEEALWQYMRGAVRVARRQPVEAAEALRLAGAASPRPWVKGRIHLELGKLADRAGDRATARLEYDRAERLCGEASDRLGAVEAAKWKNTPYR